MMNEQIQQWLLQQLLQREQSLWRETVLERADRQAGLWETAQY